MSEEEREIYSDGARRVVVRQLTKLEAFRSPGYCQLFACLEPVSVTIEVGGHSETFDLATVRQNQI